MEQELSRHTGIVETFELEYPCLTITAGAKGTVRASFNGALCELRGRDLMGMEYLLPLVGSRISFNIYTMQGRKIAGDIRPEVSVSDA